MRASAVDAGKRRIIILSLAAIVLLCAMVTITLVSGVSQESFEIVRLPEIYAADLLAHAGAVRALFGLDVYAAVFVTLGKEIATQSTRWLVPVGVGAMLATALLDMTEDHHVLAMLYGAENGAGPTAAEIAFQHTMSQVKFNVSYLGSFFFGLSVPRHTTVGKVLAALLTVGTLAQGAWLYAAPVATLPAGNLGRWIGYLLGFGLVIAMVRSRVVAAPATGAPA